MHVVSVADTQGPGLGHQMSLPLRYLPTLGATSYSSSSAAPSSLSMSILLERVLPSSLVLTQRLPFLDQHIFQLGHLHSAPQHSR